MNSQFDNGRASREPQVVMFEVTPMMSCPDGLASAWAELAQRLELNPTLAPPWAVIILDSLAPETVDAQVLVRRDSAGRVSGVLPFMVASRRMWGVATSVLQPSSNLFSYHAEVVADGNVDEMLAEIVGRCRSWDVLHFANVVSGSATEKALCNFARRALCEVQIIEGDTSPYMLIAGSWTDYLAGRNKKFRYKQRQRREQFSACNGFSLRWFTAPSQVGELLGDMLAVENRSWKSSAGLAIDQHERERRYHELLLPMLATRKCLLGIVLYKAGEPIAFSLCCSAGGWVGHLKTSFDQAYAQLSPGAYVIDLSVEWAFEHRAKEFDFLGDAAPHKMAWTGSVRRHCDHYLFGRTAKGRLLGKSKQFLRFLRAASSRRQE